MGLLFRILLMATMLGLGLKSFGQVNSPSPFLISPGNPKSVPGDSLDSDRYTVRPGAERQKRPVSSMPSKKRRKPLKQEPEQSVSPVPGPEVKDSGGTGPSENSVPSELEVAGEMFIGDDNKALIKYLKQLHPQDIRRNILEISVAPMFFYDDSQSPYWFRDYQSFGPGLSLTTKIWFSPFVGLTADLSTSLSSDISGNTTGESHITADHQWVDLGFRFRRFFNLTKKSPVLIFGLDFHEYQMKIPADETMRVGVKTTGVRLSVEAKHPHSEAFMWFAGVDIVPKGTHSELEAASDIRSGSDNETNSVGFWVGGEFRLSRKQTMFWKFMHSIEKNLFGGLANTADPNSVKPNGVVVNHSQTMLRAGFTFGN